MQTQICKNTLLRHKRKYISSIAIALVFILLLAGCGSPRLDDYIYMDITPSMTYEQVMSQVEKSDKYTVVWSHTYEDGDTCIKIESTNPNGFEYFGHKSNNLTIWFDNNNEVSSISSKINISHLGTNEGPELESKIISILEEMGTCTYSSPNYHSSSYSYDINDTEYKVSLYIYKSPDYPTKRYMDITLSSKD